MTAQPGANLYTQGFGSRPENVEVPHLDVRAPASTDILYPIGKRWLNTVSGSEYVLASQSVSSGVTASSWTLLGSGGTLNTLSDDSNVKANPSNGNIQLAGTANQITTSAAGSTVTFSLIGPYTPATYTAHGVLIGEGTSSIAATSAGTANQLLKSGGALADPSWTTATYPNTVTQGDILIATGANAIGSLADVAVGQVLKSGGIGAAPAYGPLSEFNIVDNTTGTVGSPTTVVVNTTYIADEASAITGFILPASAALGDMFVIMGNGPGGWQLKQNANQKIVGPGLTTTTGTSGSLSSTNRYDSVTLRAVVSGASTVWAVECSSGALSFV